MYQYNYNKKRPRSLNTYGLNTHTMKTQTNKTDEERNALSLAFQKAINEGLLFDIVKWKKEREQTAQDILNETETEPFTIEERTDLNIKGCVGK